MDGQQQWRISIVTEDGGKQWRDVTPPGMSIHGVIDVQASHFNPSEAYAAVRNDAIGDYSPHIYRTRDFGKSWQSIVTGLPTDEPTGSFVRVVQEDRSETRFAVRGYGNFRVRVVR